MHLARTADLVACGIDGEYDYLRQSVMLLRDVDFGVPAYTLG
jgi:hypothetical protein